VNLAQGFVKAKGRAGNHHPDQTSKTFFHSKLYASFQRSESKKCLIIISSSSFIEEVFIFEIRLEYKLNRF
jgi:hypothetical protein